MSPPSRSAPPRRRRRRRRVSPAAGPTLPLLLIAAFLSAGVRRAASAPPVATAASVGPAAAADAADAAAAAGAPDCSGGPVDGRYRALVCWLWKAKINLPDEEFREEIFTIKVEDMSCTNFQVTSLKSSSAGGSDMSVTMDLTGVSASCTGKYDGGVTSGNIVASLGGGDGPSLHLKVDVASKPLTEVSFDGGTMPANDGPPADDEAFSFPSSATVSACRPKFVVNDVQFSGSASAKIISLFSGKISKMVTAAMNQHVCELIKSNGESRMNGSIQAARKYIGDLIDNSPSVAHELPGEYAMDAERVLSGKFEDEHLDLEQITLRKAKKQSGGAGISWDKDMPFLKRILLGLNNLISNHIDEGIILKSLQKLSTWESTKSADCEDCGFFFKGFNGLVSSLTKGAGSLEFSVPETFMSFHRNHTFRIPNYGDVTLTIQKVKVSGIDKFTDLAMFRPEGQNLLSSSIASDVGFDFSALVQLEVKPAGGSAFQGGILNETFMLHLNTSKVNFKGASKWELDHEVFRKLSVGSFMYGSYTVFDNNRNLLNCVIEALRSVTIIDMHGRMDLNSVNVLPYVPAYEAGDGSDTSLEDDVDALINTVMNSFLSAYPSTTTEAMAGLIRTPARKKLNDGLANFIGDTKKMPLHCVNVDVPNNKSEHPLRLDGTRALQFFDGVVNDKSAVDAVNAFIGCVVDSVVEAKQLLAGHFYNFSLGELSVVMHDLKLENADSVYELELLKPEVDHYHLTNSLGYGKCNIANGGCEATSLSFGMNLVHAKRGNLGNVNVRIHVKDLKLVGGVEAKLDVNYLPLLQVADLLSHPQCLSVPVTNFDIYGLNSTVGMLEVGIAVNLNGGSDGPKSFTYQTKDPTELARLVSTLTSRGSSMLQEALGNEFATQFDREAARVCETPVNPHRSNARKRETGAAGLWTLLFVTAFVAGNGWLFLRGFKNEHEALLLANDEDVEDAEPRSPSEEQQEGSLSEPLLNEEDRVEHGGEQDEMDEIFEVETPRRKFPLASSSSLMYHPSTHPAVKYGFPAVLVFAFFLFLSSNVSVGASVDLIVTRANGTNLTSMINIYEFSLGSTAREMAQAGVYLLLLLILFCSGIWPYAKLVLMMMSWIASTRRLPPVKREKILYLLDSLGKFSLIDAYVLVLMMVAFRYSLGAEGVGELNVYVTPEYGFYSFLFATIVSLVSGHYMLFLHRKTMLPSIPVYSGRYESLSKHIFDDKHGRGLLKLTRKFRRTIVFALFLSFVLICVGIGLKSFHFRFSGVAGTALGDDRVRSFSLVSIGHHIPRSIQDSSSFGIHWIQTCYFFFAVVMPIACLLSLVVLFLVPMRLKQQQRAFVVAEVTNAWSAIEVFVIAIVASLIEISPFSESMVGKHCSLLNQILSGWSGGDGDDLHYCFDVKSSIGGSSAVLIIGVILNTLLVSVLHRFAHHSIAERIEREDRPDATEDENKVVRDCVLAHTFVSRLRKRPRLGKFMFEEVSFGPDGEYEIDFENVAENEEPQHTSNNFWSEWTKIVSVI